MSVRLAVLSVLVMFGIACGSSGDSESESNSAEQTVAEETESTPEATDEVEQAADVAAEDVEGALADNERDVAGLRVTFNEDGTIVLGGVDRWGARIDTTYADAEYFANAVPVLKRSVSEEQGAALDELLENMPAAPGDDQGGGEGE